MMNMKMPLSSALHRVIAAVLFTGLTGGLTVGSAYADYPVGPSPKITIARPPIPPAWKLGATAPMLHVTDLAGEKVSLSRFSGKPIVLEFGSLTEPAFRLSASSVNWLARKWKDNVQFLIVYQKESHPAETPLELSINKSAHSSIPRATDEAQRIADARLAQHTLHLQSPLITVDNWHNQTAGAYGSLPNMTFLIDAHGRLVGAWPWMTPWQLNAAIPAVLAGKPVPASAMSTGFSADAMPPMEFDYRALPPAAPQTLADAIDRAMVTQAQLTKILPAVADFSIAMLKTRQQIRQLRSQRGQFNGNFRQSVRHTFKQLRQSAVALKTSLHHWLNNAQYQQILSAMDRGQLRRVFEARNP